MNMNPTFKTLILFGTLTSLLVGVGYLLGGTTLAITFFIFSFVMNIFAYWFSDKLALGAVNAQQLTREQFPELLDDIQAIATAMNLPMPKVYISNQVQPNAFATGRNPKTSAICFTQGILKALSRDEIRGVSAHELAHIKNHDILLTTVAAIMAGAVSSLAQIGVLWGSDEDNRNPFVSIILVIVSPIAALIVQLAISRQREYAADALAAQVTQKPKDLADALVKIENYARQIPMNVNPALSSLFIMNPFSGGGITDLLSTHPSVASRVERLLAMTSL